MYGVSELIYVKQLCPAYQQVVSSNTSCLMPATETYIRGHTLPHQQLWHPGEHIYNLSIVPFHSAVACILFEGHVLGDDV